MNQWSKPKTWSILLGLFAGALLLNGVFSDDAKNAVQPANVASSVAIVKEAEVLSEQTEKPVQPEEIQEEIQPPVEEEIIEVVEGTREDLFKVTRVVDGDTIKLESGETVRYIGIDTPETVHPSKPVECFGKEASNKNKELVEGKEVRLVKDVSETDKYGRLLRYVYVGDVFVNDLLVREGFANSSSYPPDVKFQDQFRQAEKEARESKRGLWSSETCNGGKQAVNVEGAKVATPATSQEKATSGVVKKSKTSICHAPGTTYYNRTTNYTPFNSLEECLKSGGRLPKR